MSHTSLTRRLARIRASARLTDLPVSLDTLTLGQGQPSPCCASPYASFHRIVKRCGNVDPLPVGYDLRPRLRGRLTLG